MRLDEQKKSILYRCDCTECSSGRFDIIYNIYQASIIGWVRKILPKKEAKAFGKDEIILCPECAKNIEQTNQGA